MAELYQSRGFRTTGVDVTGQRREREKSIEQQLEEAIARKNELVEHAHKKHQEAEDAKKEVEKERREKRSASQQRDIALEKLVLQRRRYSTKDQQLYLEAKRRGNKVGE